MKFSQNSKVKNITEQKYITLILSENKKSCIYMQHKFDSQMNNTRESITGLNNPPSTSLGLTHVPRRMQPLN